MVRRYVRRILFPFHRLYLLDSHDLYGGTVARCFTLLQKLVLYMSVRSAPVVDSLRRNALLWNSQAQWSRERCIYFSSGHGREEPEHTGAAANANVDDARRGTKTQSRKPANAVMPSMYHNDISRTDFLLCLSHVEVLTYQQSCSIDHAGL